MPVGDTPLKLNRDAKAMVQLAFEDLGGLQRLVEWANVPANLGTFYTQIWGKIIPKDVKAEIDGTITIEIAQFEAPTQLTNAKTSAIETTAKYIAQSEGTDGED
jgi:hypothetical protein